MLGGEEMNEALPPDPAGGMAAALGTLRHALADPLSTAGLKLELLERRLATVSPAGTSLADWVRGAKADLSVAGRLIDLLPRLARIASEAPTETSIGDLCRAAGVPLGEDAAPRTRLPLRRWASTEAVRTVVSFVQSLGSGGTPPQVSAEAVSGRISLRIEALGGCGAASAEKLFHLPRGEERGEDLFIARAGIEADGGRLQLVEREGWIAVLLSWPRPAPAAGSGAPA
jgi:hypothetical protein